MTVLQKLPDGWFQVDLDGKLGYAPGNHVKLVKTEPKVRRQVSRLGGWHVSVAVTWPADRFAGMATCHSCEVLIDHQVSRLLYKQSPLLSTDSHGWDKGRCIRIRDWSRWWYRV